MNRNNRAGVFALFVVGGVYLWRNRFEVQKFLESRGIKTPVNTNLGIREAIRSGIAKIAGRTEFEANRLEEGVKRSA